LDADLAGNIGLLCHSLAEFSRVHAAVESLAIQTQLSAQLFQLIFGESALVFAILTGEK